MKQQRRVFNGIFKVQGGSRFLEIEVGKGTRSARLWSCHARVLHTVVVIPIAAKSFGRLPRSKVHELVVRMRKAPGSAHATTGALL
jgi:hypothetical protein